MDAGQSLRLKGAIEGTLESIGGGDPMNSQAALASAYGRFREEALSAVDDSARAEVERLFPELHALSSSLNTDVVIDNYHRARSLMQSLAGWLGGLIEEAQFKGRLEAEARAYAEERVRQERGVGFRAPEKPSGDEADSLKPS
jgi:hypothetical protein